MVTLNNPKIDFKDSFLNTKCDLNYSWMYSRLFKLFSRYETLLNKDLAFFTRDDLVTVFTDIRHKIKYTTAMTYNSLILDYKNWMHSQIEGVSVDTCKVEDLKNITFKQYMILNDSDIRDLTENPINMTGSDYIPIIFIKLFWITDGQEDVQDILNIRMRDINTYDNIITIGKRRYQIDTLLTELLLEFAELEEITFHGKRGAYKIYTAHQNNGYIFRTAYTKKTENILGALDKSKLPNILYQYAERYFDDRLSVMDLKMSLALKYMVSHKKTPQEMNYEKRYFKNLPTSVYTTIFNGYAKEKYPLEYKEYLDYYHRLVNINE